MTLFQAFGQFAGSGAVSPDAFQLITTTSFTATSSVSTDNVFTTDYDVYCLLVDAVSSAAGVNIAGRMRVGGVDASGTNYQRQYFGSSTLLDSLSSSFPSVFSSTSTKGNCVLESWLFYPARSEYTTVFKSVATTLDNVQTIFKTAEEHKVATAYDGITLIPATGTMTGTAYFYGLAVA